MKLDKKIFKRIDWETLRKNTEEKTGDLMTDFDGYVTSHSKNEEFILEYTNVYTFTSQKDKSLFEQVKRGKRQFSENLFIKPNTDLKSFSDDCIRAFVLKNNKRYMDRDEKKILVLEVSGIYFGIFIMENFMKIDDEGTPVGDLNLRFIKYMKNKILKNSNNKFDEIIFRTYPNQYKETLYFLGGEYYCHDKIISLKKGFQKK